MKKQRLDILVVEKKLADSRAKAQALILAGEVFVVGERVSHPSKLVEANAEIEVHEKFPYVSRGALKLKAAVEAFKIDFKNKIVADIGASTGGFTDLALALGAKKVYAIDVGTGQLAQKLRQDQRVVVMEKTNIRNVKSLPEKIDIFTIDVSFISLKLVLPKIKELTISYKLKAISSEIIALIKPQFEATRAEASKGKGVIRDAKIHERVIAEIEETATKLSFAIKGLIESPIRGPAGNKEFLIMLSFNRG